MDTALTRFLNDRWPLARVLFLILGGAFAGLMIDIRIEHADVVYERSITWLPIFYSGFMAIGCLAAVVRWNASTRLVLRTLFLLAFAIGGTGFYLHNHGNLQDVARTMLNVWSDPHATHSQTPPQLAPLAFAGLGVIGILASLERFNAPS